MQGHIHQDIKLCGEDTPRWCPKGSCVHIPMLSMRERGGKTQDCHEQKTVMLSEVTFIWGPKGLIRWTTSSSFGVQRARVTDYLINADLNLPD